MLDIFKTWLSVFFFFVTKAARYTTMVAFRKGSVSE